MPLEDREIRERVARLEGLLAELEGAGDAAATRAVQALLELYGEGLARILERAERAGGAALPLALAEDELVGHLLLLHGLHPVDAEQRVQQALEEVRPYLASHGGGVALLRIEEGVAHLRLQGSCNGCPSSAMTLRMAIEDAIRRTAPDLLGIEAEGVAEPPPALVQLGPRPQEAALPESAWAMVGGLPQLSSGGLLLQEVSGEAVLFLKLAGTPYAYRPACPGCGASLVRGTLAGAELACAGCGRRYDVQRAGRCLDEPILYLEPVPLLVDRAGLVRVALAAATG